MTPAEHIAEAENQLAIADTAEDDGVFDWASEKVQKAIAHALIALAVELGVPHTPANTSGG